MDKKKKERLEAAGWKVGDAKDFLELTDMESEYVELKLKLSAALRERRNELGVSQEMVAKQIQSSQSRVAKMESGDSTVSIDLLIRALLQLGLRRPQLARLIGTKAA